MDRRKLLRKGLVVGMMGVLLVSIVCLVGCVITHSTPDFDYGNFKAHKKQAKRGDPKSQLWIGRFYQRGKEGINKVAVNKEEAVKWFKKPPIRAM